MKGMGRPKGLADIRTIIGTHGRSTPRNNRHGYLDAYALDRELKRMEQELEALDKRRARVEARLNEVRRALAQVLSECGEPPRSPEPPARVHTASASIAGELANHVMTIEY
jgi:hypothetical protein